MERVGVSFLVTLPAAIREFAFPSPLHVSRGPRPSHNQPVADIYYGCCVEEHRRRQKLPRLLRGFDMSTFLMVWAGACPVHSAYHIFLPGLRLQANANVGLGGAG